MLADPNVVLYSIILSGLLSMSVVKDIQGENVWLSNTQCNEKSIILGSTIIRVTHSGNIYFIVSSVPVSSEGSIAA